MTKVIETSEDEPEVAPEAEIDRTKSPMSSYPTNQVPVEITEVEEQPNEVRSCFLYLSAFHCAEFVYTDYIMPSQILKWNSSCLVDSE